MCGQRRPRSDCAYAQSDLGLRCPQTELLDTIECFLSIQHNSTSIPDISILPAKCCNGFGNHLVFFIISVQALDRVLPKHVNLLPTFSFCHFKLVTGSLYDLSGAGWCTTSVFWYWMRYHRCHKLMKPIPSWVFLSIEAFFCDVISKEKPIQHFSYALVLACNRLRLNSLPSTDSQPGWLNF